MVYSSVSQTVFTRGSLLLASKNTSMNPHIFARVNIVCSDDRYPKFKIYISELSQIARNTTYVNNALHHLTLLKPAVARLVVA